MRYCILRGGRPPLAPLTRAAAALASERTLPPSLPSATAAGFLRGTGLHPEAPAGEFSAMHQSTHAGDEPEGGLRGSERRHGHGAGIPVAGAVDKVFPHGVYPFAVVPLNDDVSVCHGTRIANRLGSVKWG